jgi:FixJ family two-component response regulator
MSDINPVVYFVDDDASVRRALARLARSAGLDAEEFASAGEFLARRRDDRPCCAVFDLRMPEVDGLELQQRLRTSGEELPVIFLSGHGDVPSSVRAMKAGAIDFLTKPCEDDELLAAIRQAIDRSMHARAEHAERVHLRARFAALTARERQVCELVATGMLNKQVAFDLGISEKTVKVHRARVMQKLGVDSLADLVRLVGSLTASTNGRPR